VIGEELGHYRILERIGKGAMGEIFLAEDTRLGRKVALKVLPPGSAMDEGRLQRFRLEARAVAAMNHPNIVTIHSVEEVDKINFLAMEYVEGRTLRDLIPRAGLPFDEFLRIATELTQAVSAAHSAGITHRDLKPENVMITLSGSVKVLDFGLAKVIDEPRVDGLDLASVDVQTDHDANRLTRDDKLIGTIPYMSPEHVAGRGIDHRSDLFSLAIILYEMLTGERPFGGETPASLMASILHKHPRPISSDRYDVPEHLRVAIALCLEKDPAERLQSAESLFEHLRILQRQHSSGGLHGDDMVAVRPRTMRTTASTVFRRLPAALSRHRIAIAILTVVFSVNFVETLIETTLRDHHLVGHELEAQLARAADWFEGPTLIDSWDFVPPTVVYGYSIAYFFVLLALVVATGAALATRPTLRPFRRFALAIAVGYAVSLPFFIFFPVPERWAWPDSGAILLSDLWAPSLIELFRPISGLNNCFPSFHVSLTTVIVGLCFVERLRYRWVALWLGLLVMLSTLVLGIHWVTDVVAGLATGVLAVASALLLERRITWPAAGSPPVPRPPTASSSAPS
jgi:serine/threonine protein kinase/membrane-associated phospholipid phosphatase